MTVGCTLNDAEEEWGFFLTLAGDPVSAPLSPAQGAIQTGRCIFLFTRIRRALVESHRYIRPERSLYLHRNFRTEKAGGSVDVIVEVDSFLGNSAKFSE